MKKKFTINTAASTLYKTGTGKDGALNAANFLQPKEITEHYLNNTLYSHHDFEPYFAAKKVRDTTVEKKKRVRHNCKSELTKIFKTPLSQVEMKDAAETFIVSHSPSVYIEYNIVKKTPSNPEPHRGKKAHGFLTEKVLNFFKEALDNNDAIVKELVKAQENDDKLQKQLDADNAALMDIHRGVSYAVRWQVKEMVAELLDNKVKLYQSVMSIGGFYSNHSKAEIEEIGDNVCYDYFTVENNIAILKCSKYKQFSIAIGSYVDMLMRDPDNTLPYVERSYKMLDFKKAVDK